MKPRETTHTRIHTSQVLHSNLELLPVPNVLPVRHLLHDRLELIEPLSRPAAHEVHAYAMPELLGHFALLAPRFDGCEPYRRVLLRLAVVSRRVRPRRVHSLEVIWFLEHVEHGMRTPLYTTGRTKATRHTGCWSVARNELSDKGRADSFIKIFLWFNVAYVSTTLHVDLKTMLLTIPYWADN